MKKEEEKLLAKEMGIDVAKVKALKKKLAKIEPRSERGTETMFRLVSKNHYTLNSMVDRKSNILISINAIILSIIIGTVMHKMEEDPHLIVPVVLLLLTNITSIIYAVIATRPDLTHGKPTDTEETPGSSNNVLFFGNFHGMKEEEYIESLRSLMYSGDRLYDCIARDVFYLGQNINKKFKFLRISFNIFMFGLATSVLFFIICHVFFNTDL